MDERHTYAGSGYDRLSAYDYASALSEWCQVGGRGSSTLDCYDRTADVSRLSGVPQTRRLLMSSKRPAKI